VCTRSAGSDGETARGQLSQRHSDVFFHVRFIYCKTKEDIMSNCARVKFVEESEFE
jgi:hypothetical protein